jgi:hypothetical protein
MTAPLLDPIPPGLQPLYDYWNGKRRARKMPRRADIDPLELGPYLSRLMIVDVVDDERRYVYRLVGTAEVTERGRDPTGRAVGEAFIGSSLEKVLSNYDRVMLTRAPHIDTGSVITLQDKLDESHVIFLPISEDDTKVSQILVYTVFAP